MRDFVNPLVLLAGVVLLACRAGGGGDVVMLDGWILALTVTAFIVNGALCMARLLARRRALMSVVWAMGYLILGSCAWVLHGMVQQTADEEQAALLVLKQAWQQGGSPFLVDESGDSLFTTAASLGKAELVQEGLATGSAPAEQLAEAARRAAENGRVDVLKLLYLIRYIDNDVPANLDNIVILMADDIRVDKITLRETVRESLNRLLSQNYIGRTGETYNFLTDEEQDIQRAIKNETSVDTAAIVERIEFSGIPSAGADRSQDRVNHNPFTIKVFLRL